MFVGPRNLERGVTKYIFFLCAFVATTGIFTFVGAMRNTLNNLHELGMTKERIPNQQLYQNILNRDVYSLNLSTPEISSSVDVIVLVSSHPDDIQLRNAIRSTWANASNSEAIKNTSVSVIFLLGKNTSADLRYEIKRHKDILQVEIEDTYLNLVYKLLSAYRWIHANYPETFVFKIDADVVINLDEIKSLLDEGAKPIIQCHINYLVSPIRNFNSRWYIPWYAWSEQYLPDYCNGAMYLIGPIALKKILSGTKNVQVFEVEDAFFTGVLTTLTGIQIKNEKRIWTIKKVSQPCVNGRPTVIGFPNHFKKTEEIIKSYKNLKNIRCQNIIEYLYLKYFNKG